jgi:hypothetical protein
MGIAIHMPSVNQSKPLTVQDNYSSNSLISCVLYDTTVVFSKKQQESTPIYLGKNRIVEFPVSGMNHPASSSAVELGQRRVVQQSEH